ncbi:A disintegrin and metallo ase with thrombospondin motifs 3-like [Paramuricea clavata]|uniref:A disintegrin and metallo ase with thrombospondin motifs 3-like n=1 Tax=Paramuricea clavata TaxID=317549 RepID=A0A6S7GC73_PARCT|nr:A disintegrin and metallo ase with thrombospondin motifs 3-like [Paramuricea clavata]
MKFLNQIMHPLFFSIFLLTSFKVCPKRVSEKDAVCVVAGRKNAPGRTWKFYDDSTANLDCTFEAGTCGWSNDKTTGLKQWTLHKGRTPSSYTGPSVDQTLKTAKGQYIYFEASTPTKAKAVLSSPFIKIRQGCLEFSYHMWGDNKMGQLKVVKFTGGVSTVLWRMSGNKGNRWYRHKINVQNYSPYKLSFLAKKKGAGYKSDIALDDITFRSGLCSSSSTTQKEVEENPCKIKCITSDKKSPTRIMFPVHVYDGTTCSTKTTTGVCYRGICKTLGCDNILTDGKKGNCVVSTGRRQGQTPQPVRPKSTITRTITRTTTTRSRSPLNCDFNRNFCHWRNLAAKSSQNIRGNDLNWLRQREGGTGYYLRIRPSRQKGIKVGSIASPEVKIARACLSFSYKLSRKGAYSRLRIKWLVRYGNAQVTRTKRYLSVTESWKEEKIDFQISQSYKIVFEATLSAGLTGIIGIDNIRFDPGRCPSNKVNIKYNTIYDHL